MDIIHDFSEANPARPTFVTVGSYDGLHVGHQHLLGQMQTAARRQDAMTVVVTFHPRPLAVLAPHVPARYLTSQRQKERLLQAFGIDLTAIIPFTRQLAQQPARQFVETMTNHLRMRALWVGPDFALGRNREGDIPALREMGQDLGFEVFVMDPLQRGGEIVSSTRIRKLLENGKIREATDLLGRYPTLEGTVIHGQERGRRLGFPTANITIPGDMVRPANGVYACFVWIDGVRWMAVTNMGTRPTFDDTEHFVEAYVIGFDGVLYGKTIGLELVDYLRPEVRFDSVEALVAQMNEDTHWAEHLLQTVPDNGPNPALPPTGTSEQPAGTV